MSKAIHIIYIRKEININPLNASKTTYLITYVINISRILVSTHIYDILPEYNIVKQIKMGIINFISKNPLV